MNEVPVKNDGKTTRYVGGFAIPPGETRILPAASVPRHLHRAPTPVEPKEAPDTFVADTLDGTVDEIKAILPTITAEDLDVLETAEMDENGKNRKGVLNAIQEERLNRAANAELETFRSEVRTILTEDELLTLAEQFEADDARTGIIMEQMDTLANPSGADNGKQGSE